MSARSGEGVCTLLAALCLGGCLNGTTESEIKAQFAAYVNTANMCTAASECALAAPGCPLGCYIAVRADRKLDVEAKARALIADYERGGRSCVYDCTSPGPITCTDNRCSVSPDFGGVRDAGAPD